jgi:hypothetical protein
MRDLFLQYVYLFFSKHALQIKFIRKANFNRVPWWRYFAIFLYCILDSSHTCIAVWIRKSTNKCSNINNNNESFIPFAYGHPWHSRKMENVGVHQPLYHVKGLSSPCHHAAILPCYHASMLPCYHATMLKCYHATMLPCSMLPYATMLP